MARPPEIATFLADSYILPKTPFSKSTMFRGKGTFPEKGKSTFPPAHFRSPISTSFSPYFPPPSPAPPSPSLLPIREPSGEPPQESNHCQPRSPHPGSRLSSPPRFPFGSHISFPPPIGWKPRYDGILSHLWPNVGAGLGDQEWVPAMRPILLPNGVPRVVPILHTHGFCTVAGICFWEKKGSGNEVPRARFIVRLLSGVKGKVFCP